LCGRRGGFRAFPFFRIAHGGFAAAEVEILFADENKTDKKRTASNY
jgi:hypothetical protein